MQVVVRLDLAQVGRTVVVACGMPDGVVVAPVDTGISLGAGVGVIVNLGRGQNRGGMYDR